MTAQELIEGTDTRIYVVKDKIFALEIPSEKIDFRAEENAKRVPVKLPDNIERECFNINNILNLI